MSDPGDETAQNRTRAPGDEPEPTLQQDQHINEYRVRPRQQ